VQLLGCREGSLPVFPAVAAREGNKFDLVAAGGAFEAIERARFLAAAVIADDETIEALAEGARPFPLPRSFGLQTRDAKKPDNLIHRNRAFDFVEVNTILRCHVNLLYVTECIILYDGHEGVRSKVMQSRCDFS
jgi:hypothetical protein